MVKIGGIHSRVSKHDLLLHGGTVESRTVTNIWFKAVLYVQVGPLTLKDIVIFI